MQNQRLKQLAAIRRSELGRSGLRRKAPKWLYPYALEREYQAQILSLLRVIHEDIRNRLIDRLPSLKAQAEVSLNVRGDDFIDDIEEIFRTLTLGASQVFVNLEGFARSHGLEVSNFNQQQYRKVIRVTLGVDPISNDEFLSAQMKRFSRQNSLLIKSIPDSLLREVEELVLRRIGDGSDVRVLASDIENRFRVSRNRARLIARDQTAKLNAELTEVRQRRIGVNDYIWNTVGDERVRNTHLVLDGKLCTWDDPSVYKNIGETEWRSRSSINGFIGHPGTDYQCRCFSEPVIDDLIDES